MSTSESTLPLSGVRVVEFGSLIAGPLSTRFFADFGAEVIKVEAPGQGDPMRAWGPITYKGRGLVWPTQSRNKKAITINMREKDGQQLAKKLIAKADMVVENFRPGTMERWGLGWDELQSVNPGLIFIRVSGYGQTGPYRHRAGLGSAAGAMGGLRYLTGFPDRPPSRVGLSLEDSMASLQAVIGGLLALRHREVNGGRGQVVDVSITEAVFSMTEGAVTEYGLTGHVRQREGTVISGVAPANIYQAKDGVWMVIAANADNPFRRLFELIGRPDIAGDPKYRTHDGRWQDRDLLDQLIGEWAIERESSEISDVLEEAGVPSAPIYSAAEIYNDRYFWERGDIIEVDDPEIGKIPMPGVLPHLVATPGRINWTGPATLGQHNAEVFKDVVGLTDAELEDYSRRGLI